MRPKSLREGLALFTPSRPNTLVYRAGLYVFCACLTLISLSCSEEVSDIDRVQPHYLKKSDLEGSWYARQTVVDHPSHIAFAFSGLEGPLEKIEWEIREHQLIARRMNLSQPTHKRMKQGGA